MVFQLNYSSNCICSATAFQDKNAAKKAREQLESFPQGLKKVDVWMAEIETLFSKAGLTMEEEKIRLLDSVLLP
jgi:hypothetical protein